MRMSATLVDVLYRIFSAVDFCKDIDELALALTYRHCKCRLYKSLNRCASSILSSPFLLLRRSVANSIMEGAMVVCPRAWPLFRILRGLEIPLKGEGATLLGEEGRFELVTGDNGDPSNDFLTGYNFEVDDGLDNVAAIGELKSGSRWSLPLFSFQNLAGISLPRDDA